MKQTLKNNLIKILWITLVLTVVIVAICSRWTANAINPNSEKIAELSYQVNELESHKNLCLDNLPYRESVENANGIHTYCDMYDELIMKYQEEIDKLKEWRPAASETETAWTSEIREPWMVSGDHQVMPEIQAETSHDRFKKMCEAYWLDASTIRKVENTYWIKEWVILCITVAETSWGNRWYGKGNPWNVGNNDRWDRVTFAFLETGLEKIWQTLNNRYLGNIQTLGCLSNGGSCQSWDNNSHRYATSNGNRERNMVACLSTIYGTVDAKTFSIRR